MLPDIWLPTGSASGKSNLLQYIVQVEAYEENLSHTDVQLEVERIF